MEQLWKSDDIQSFFYPKTFEESYGVKRLRNVSFLCIYV